MKPWWELVPEKADEQMDKMRREPWKYWSLLTKENIAYLLIRNAEEVSKSIDKIPPKLHTLIGDMEDFHRAIQDLLVVIGYPKQQPEHPSTQPIGMGEESAP